MGCAGTGAEGGNKSYCVPIKLAAEKAKLPGFCNSKMYRDFQKGLGLICESSLRNIVGAALCHEQTLLMKQLAYGYWSLMQLM